eukprot:NODE_153_length_15389_cov_1.201439.p3 type:complete len:398 gc:universal NODE_153_length_15389_cov_1.201439:11885-10692(-)
MKIFLTYFGVSTAVNNEYKSLEVALKDLLPITDETSKKIVKFSFIVKNTNRKAAVKRYSLETVEQCENSDNLIEIRSNRTSELQNQNNHILVLVNPKSGKKKGRKIIDKVEPLLKLMNLNFTIIITKSQRHIDEINFAMYSKIIFISGDGLIFDYLQVSVKKQTLDIPIAVIKAGTGNALATCLDCLDFEIALLTAIFGQTKQLDLTKYTFNTLQYYSLLGFFWGLLSDIDLGSEKFRCMGRLRTEIAAVYYLLRKKNYEGVLSYRQGNTFKEEKINMTCFLALSLPFLDEEHFGCPYARLSDGYIHILHNKLSIKNGLKMLLDGRDAKKFKSIKWTYVKTTEYTLTPTTNKTLMDLDGEFMPHSKLCAIVSPSLKIQVMAPEWLDEDIMTGTSRDE